jgi:hypothetical protein
MGLSLFDILFHLPSAKTVSEVTRGLGGAAKLSITDPAKALRLAPLRPVDYFGIVGLAVATPVIIGTTLAGAGVGAAAGATAATATGGSAAAAVGGGAAVVGVGGTLGAVAITTAGQVAKTGIVAGTAWSLLQDPKILLTIAAVAVAYLYLRSGKK